MTYGYSQFTYTHHIYVCHGHFGLLLISSIVLFQSGIILQHISLTFKKQELYVELWLYLGCSLIHTA